MLGTDPFFLFCISILLTPLLVTTGEDDASHTLSPRPFNPSEWVNHFTDPAMLAGAAFVAFGLYHAAQHPALSRCGPARPLPRAAVRASYDALCS